MKCEKCDKEAVFHYQSNINGEKNEYHLCTDCAKAAGLAEMLEFRPTVMMNSFLSQPFGGLMRNFFREPFGAFDALANGYFGRSPFAPVLSAPSVNISIGKPEEATETEKAKTDNIPIDAGSELKAKRELHALRHQLKEAIRTEEFEKAAELRDKIHELEK